MAPSLKMASLVAIVLLVATPQARGWAAEGDRVSDMVPQRTPSEQALPGDAGTMVASSFCANNCRCCSGSNPESCQTIKCCSSISCETPTNCTIVQDCGCRC